MVKASAGADELTGSTERTPEYHLFKQDGGMNALLSPPYFFLQ